MSRRTLCFWLVLLACAGCGVAPSGSEPQTARTQEQQVAEVLEAFLSDILTHGLGADGQEYHFYLELEGKDPSAGLLADINRLPAPVLPASHCPKWTPGVDTNDKLIVVEELKWLSADRVQVWNHVFHHWGEVEKCGTCFPTTYVRQKGRWVEERQRQGDEPP